MIFVDQSYWLTGTAAKPTHSVWGFITGGLSWFALAFVTSFGLGAAYVAFSVEQGYHLVNDDEARDGEGRRVLPRVGTTVVVKMTKFGRH